jgi:hypothetical protein
MGVTLKVLRRGTHRSASLDDTVKRALRLAPIMGITRVANVTGLDSVGIPVVMVCRPNSRSVAVSQGKGIDLSCGIHVFGSASIGSLALPTKTARCTPWGCEIRVLKVSA